MIKLTEKIEKLASRRGQGSIEYILLVGAILLFVVIAVVITKGKIFTPAVNVTQTNQQQYAGVTQSICNIPGQTCPVGYGCYQANGSCLANILTEDAGFEDNTGVWVDVTATAQRVDTNHYEGEWSMRFDNIGAMKRYGTDLENANGTYALGIQGKTNNGTCAVAIAIENVSYAGACGAWTGTPYAIGSSTSTSWLPVHTSITLTEPSCLRIYLAEDPSSPSDCYAYADSAYLIKVS